MTGFAFQTILEVLLVVAVFWGIFNEDKLIVLERRLFCAIRRRTLKVLKGEKNRSNFRILEGGR